MQQFHSSGLIPVAWLLTVKEILYCRISKGQMAATFSLIFFLSLFQEETLIMSEANTSDDVLMECG